MQPDFPGQEAIPIPPEVGEWIKLSYATRMAVDQLFRLANGRRSRPALGSPYRTAVRVFAGRLYDALGATTELCRLGWPHQAGLVLRSVFELVLIAKHIQRGPREELSQRWRDYEAVCASKQLENYRKAGGELSRDEQACADEVRRRRQEFYRKWGRSNPISWHGSSVSQLAETHDMMGLYLEVYAPYSDTTHSNALSLRSQVRLAGSASKVLYGPRWGEETAEILRHTLLLVFDFMKIWLAEVALEEEAESIISPLVDRWVILKEIQQPAIAAS